mgnify:CR=1 FL=1
MIIRIAVVFLLFALPALRQAASASPAALQKATTILLWDIPRTSQIRGTVTLQALPGRSVAPGFTVRVSLKAAGPGPDPAVIGMGTCTFYKKFHSLNPAVNGLSNTTIARQLTEALEDATRHRGYAEARLLRRDSLRSRGFELRP